MFSQLAFLYRGILVVFLYFLFGCDFNFRETISRSETSGIVSVLANVDEFYGVLSSCWFIWIRLYSSSISLNLVWILEYWVLSFNVLVFHSHSGRLKSPTIIIFDFAFTSLIFAQTISQFVSYSGTGSLMYSLLIAISCFPVFTVDVIAIREYLVV